jgi:hypothetical protein
MEGMPAVAMAGIEDEDDDASTVTASTVTASTVTASTVTASTATASTVTASTVTASTVTASTVTASTVTASTVTASTVTESDLKATVPKNSDMEDEDKSDNEKSDAEEAEHDEDCIDLVANERKPQNDPLCLFTTGLGFLAEDNKCWLKAMVEPAASKNKFCDTFWPHPSLFSLVCGQGREKHEWHQTYERLETKLCGMFVEHMNQ